MKKSLLSFFLLFGIIFIFSCGGGGGGGDGDEDNQSPDFALYEAGFFQPGHIESYSITGTDIAGGKYEGTFSLNTKDTVIIEGETETPITELFNLKNTTKGVFISVSTTTYYTSDKSPVMMIVDNPATTYLPISIAKIPDTAKIGNFGPLTSWASDDGTSISGNWSLEKNNDSNKADFVTMTTSVDNTGQTIVYQEMTRIIDKTGVAQKMTIQWNYPQTGIIVNLEAQKTM